MVERADDGKAKAVEVTGPNGTNPQVKVRSKSAECSLLRTAARFAPIAACFIYVQALFASPEQMTCSCSEGLASVKDTHLCS